MAFISSELIPAKLHGTKFDGLVHGEWGSQPGARGSGGGPWVGASALPWGPLFGAGGLRLGIWASGAGGGLLIS